MAAHQLEKAIRPYDAIAEAVSLHWAWPAVPMAAARNQYFVPLVRAGGLRLLNAEQPGIFENP